MKKLFNICLIVFVLFSQFISFPYNQAKAETLKETSLFDTVEMKDATDHIIDEAKNPNNLIKIGSTIQVEYAWSIKRSTSCTCKRYSSNSNTTCIKSI